MAQLSFLIKPASSLCNLRCKYCFYANVSSLRDVPNRGVMSAADTDQMLAAVKRALKPGDSVHFAFQGGEPTVAGLDYFRHFAAVVDGWEGLYAVSYALQTNATLLDDDWCEFLAQRGFLVGVSLDLLPASHDAVRVDASGNGTFKRVLEAIRLLEQHHVEYNVLCTLTGELARHPQQIWAALQRLKIRYVQFTPCLDELDAPGESVYALTPKRFADFYAQLFRSWLPAFENGDYTSVKLFDDIVNLMAYGVPTACGLTGTCQLQFVVEADGSVYPCDFFCMDDYRMGSILTDSLDALRASPSAESFLHRPHEQPPACRDCRYQRFCGGNCKRMQREICCTAGSDYCGYRELLDLIGGPLQRIAVDQRRLRQRK